MLLHTLRRARRVSPAVHLSTERSPSDNRSDLAYPPSRPSSPQVACLFPNTYRQHREVLCILSHLVHKVVQLLVTVTPPVGTLYTSYNTTGEGGGSNTLCGVRRSAMHVRRPASPCWATMPLPCCAPLAAP